MYAYRRVIKTISKYNKIYQYVDEKGKVIADKKTLEYIKSLKIPPGYDDVEINLNPRAKILAVGYDSKDRRQYIYNPVWVEQRSSQKYCNLIQFGKRLPEIEREIAGFLARKTLDKDKIIAIVIRVMMECSFRIGNPIGRDQYNSFGITTLTPRHVVFNGKNAKIDFIGKKGVQNVCLIRDNQLNKLLRELYQARTHNKTSHNGLFSYHNPDTGKAQQISSTDVNQYLKKYGDFTSKDFRTWYANIHFIEEIGKFADPTTVAMDTEKIRKSCSLRAITNTAEKLHHTVAICKKKYINSDLIDIYVSDPELFSKLVYRPYRKTGHSNVALLSFLKHFCHTNN